MVSRYIVCGSKVYKNLGETNFNDRTLYAKRSSLFGRKVIINKWNIQGCANSYFEAKKIAKSLEDYKRF